MTGILNNIHLALPEMVVLATACIVLLTSLFQSSNTSKVTLLLSLAGLFVALVLSFNTLNQYEVMLFNQSFVSDDLAALMKVFILISVMFVFVYAADYFIERQMAASDFYVIALFSTLGMMVLVSSYNLLTMYMGLELLSLPLYAMTAMRRTDGDGAEAAVKYFVMGALASGMILYGMSLLYGATGKLNLHDIANSIAINWQTNSHLVIFALVFLIAGAGFKLAAVPFHMWAPDVYQGAPLPVTMFISAAPKIAGLALLIRLLTVALAGNVVSWQPVLIVMSIASIAIGNLLAIAQDNLKRLLAYSAISHSGYALLGVVSATAAGYASALYYMLVYAITAVAGFGLMVMMSRNGQEVERIDELSGLNQRQPWLAFLFMLVMFSMAGVPPLVGFFTKMLVLKSLIDVGLVWVAIVGLLFAVVGAYYYLRIVKVMYFDAPLTQQELSVGRGLCAVYSINALSLLWLGILPGALIAACVKVFAS